VKTENRSVLRKSRFGSFFDISVQFFGFKRTDGITTKKYIKQNWDYFVAEIILLHYINIIHKWQKV